MEYCGAGNRLNVYALSNYTTPTIPRTIDNYKYAGCYTEPSNGRALPSASNVDYNAMTLNTCAAFCRGYNFFGVEYAGEVSSPVPFFRMGMSNVWISAGVATALPRVAALLQMGIRSARRRVLGIIHNWLVERLVD